MSRTRLTRALIPGVVALAAMALVAPAASARPTQAEPSGGIGLRVVDVPTASEDDPRARIYVVDHLAPGTVTERRVEVSNATDAPQEVALYASGASIQDGTFVGADGSTANDLSSWTSVTPAASSLSSGATATAVVRIAIPDDAAPGEQYGVVWAEVRGDPAADGVTEVSRVGIRLYVSVGPGGAPASDFEIEALTASRTDGGQPVLTATVHNTGGRALDLSGTVQLTDGPGGLGAGPFETELGTTLGIGDTRELTIALDDELPNGPWDVSVVLHSGSTERQADATVTFPDSGTSAAVAPQPADDTPPRSIVLLAAVALVAVVLLYVATPSLRRLRRHPPISARHLEPSR